MFRVKTSPPTPAIRKIQGMFIKNKQARNTSYFKKKKQQSILFPCKMGEAFFFLFLTLNAKGKKQNKNKQKDKKTTTTTKTKQDTWHKHVRTKK